MSRALRMEEQLSVTFEPAHLQLVDESHQHSVPDGAESHFNLLIVTDAFEGMRLVQRHQAVYRALAEELSAGLHALTLKTLTPAEWQEDGAAAASPRCMGGSKRSD